jgi:ubiquinol-cytochrome c reductase cytochrome c1 subunit
MRELKILAVVVIFTLITYFGIEPFAHKEMHAHVDPANFNMEQEDINLINSKIKELQNVLQKTPAGEQKTLEAAQKELEETQTKLSAYQEFWALANEAKSLKGDAVAGAEAFSMSCIACHGLNSQGMDSPFDAATASEAYGVVVPDLSDAGAIYDESFLAGLILNPVHALKLDHKFNDDKPFPMTQFTGVGDDINKDVADIIAYLKSIAPSEIEGKAVFESACLRCHDMKYDKLYTTTEKAALANYMGSNPPDLSMMIRSRGAEYLETFINDPQKNIPGTSMPRVGLNKEAQEKLVSYMEQVGDSKKGERTTVGFFLIGFFIILSVLAYLWKKEVWKELH